MNFEAAAIHLWYQDGNRNQFKDADETTRDFYLDRAHEIVEAAVGDMVLYERATVHSHGGTGGDGCTNLRCDKGLGPCFGMTQVYPEVKE